MKVYLVTQGSYSDYHIDSVFLDRALAEERVEKMGRVEPYSYDAAEIEEWDVSTDAGTLETRYFVDREGVQHERVAWAHYTDGVCGWKTVEGAWDEYARMRPQYEKTRAYLNAT